MKNLPALTREYFIKDKKMRIKKDYEARLNEFWCQILVEDLREELIYEMFR